MFRGSTGISQNVVLAAAANASTTLVNAVNGSAIVVTSLLVSANAAGTMTFKTNATGITGALAVAANGLHHIAYTGGLFATNASEPLVVTTSTSSTLSGVLTYVLTTRT